MARRPEDRFASMGEIVTALGPWLGARGPSGTRVASIGLVLLAAGGLGAWILQRPTQAPLVAPSAAPAPAAAAPAGLAFHPTRLRRMTFGEDCEEFPTFTPDGKEIVYDATRGTDSSIVALAIDTGAQRVLTTTQGWDFAAEVSPDGAHVAFLRATPEQVGTFVVRLDGTSEPRLVAPGQFRPTFSPDGAAVWAGEHLRPTRYDLATMKATRAVDSPAGTVAPRGRELSDGTLVVLFPLGAGAVVGGLAAFPTDAPMRWLSREKLGEALAFTPDGRFAVTSRLTEASNYELVAIPRDGGAATVLANRDVAPTSGLAFSADGARFAWSTCRDSNALVRIDAAGRMTALTPGVDWEESAVAPVPRAARGAASGANRIVVISRRGGATSAPWVVDRDGRAPPRQLDAPMTTPASHVAVSPDGALVAVQADTGIVLAPLDGSPRRALTSLAGDTKPAFRAGGKQVVFTRITEGSPPRVFVADLAGGDARPLLESGTSDAAPAPTGERLAYLSGPDGAHLVPMLADLATGRRARLSPKLNEGRYRELAFSPDGRRIVLLSGSNEIVEVDATTGAVVRTISTGSSMVQGLSYGLADADRGEILAARTQWVGDVWIADLR
jgi:Tol biopolymer transport system component